MKRLALLALCLTAVLAVSATGASAAAVYFANPSGSITVEAGGGERFNCESDFREGYWEPGVGVVYTSIEALGCSPAMTASGGCHSASAPEGTIKPKPLTVELGYLNKSKGEVGYLERPTSGETFAAFECKREAASELDELDGGVIATITPVNVMTTQFTQAWRQKMGVQEWTRFEGGPSHALSMSINKGAFEPVGLSDSGTMINDEEEVRKGKKIVKRPVLTEIKTGGPRPLMGKCVKRKRSKYSDANCTIPAPEKKGKLKGRYEFEAF